MSGFPWLEIVGGAIAGLLGLALTIATIGAGVYVGLWLYGAPHV